MQNCRGLCHKEHGVKAFFRLGMKKCAVCEYSIKKDDNRIRCYCCSSTYRYKAHGATRKETNEILLAQMGKSRL